MVRFLSVSLALSAALIFSPTNAQNAQVSDEEARDLFLSSVILQGQIEVCGRRVPKLSGSLAEALVNWKMQNETTLTRGETVARKEWGDQLPSFEYHLQHYKLKAAELFEVASDADIQDKCQSLLEK